MIDTLMNNSAAASLLPTGSTVLQSKDRAQKAGTEGPPETAVTRSAETERPSNLPERIADKKERDAVVGSEVMRSTVEVRSQDADKADDDAASRKLKAKMADDAYQQTMLMTRQAEEVRAERMRIAA
ncbi:hypothetical protein [Yoonia sediminilitoris]|uniref:Uncharacterized protein n=1 Tax=Yoonia sediminilitoris TaxID=1286148 RepID=A0A2T6K7K8_9RHOB|nr:hypothetical protein [Yoonia sediminilitoris]PUB10708.1 hypothetical protein C8N45_11753 [Yoonia sediminilitoris]RCW90460.1 hypothetical protein DFP92_11753 [Yoonia sediminilitoris]